MSESNQLFQGLEEMGFSNLNNVQLFPEEKPQNFNSPHAVKEFSPEEFLYDKSHQCPICDMQFKERTLKKGKVRLVSSDTDLRPYYEPMDPIFYDVILCPRCGYAALTSYFQRVSSTQRKWLIEQVATQYRTKEYPAVFTAEHAIERYKMALLSAAVKKAKASEKAYICMKLAWLYRTLPDEKQERLFIEHAFLGYKEAYEKENFPLGDLDEYTAAYLIAEFARRLGKYEESLRWLTKVILGQGTNKRLKDRAIDQKEWIRKAMKNT